MPSHLDWSGHAVYDLDAPGRVVDLYRAVLIEAATPQDLYAYLDERVLRRLWALLWLPAQLRRAWEQRFPVLAAISPNIFHTGDLRRMTAHLGEAVALLGPDIALAHAKDLDHDGAAGGLAAGRGRLDYRLVLTLLKGSGYDGAIILHGLHGLTAAEVDASLDHVRSHAPKDYLT